jgi:hypothetical protein
VQPLAVFGGVEISNVRGSYCIGCADQQRFRFYYFVAETAEQTRKRCIFLEYRRLLCGILIWQRGVVYSTLLLLLLLREGPHLVLQVHIGSY